MKSRKQIRQQLARELKSLRATIKDVDAKIAAADDRVVAGRLQAIRDKLEGERESVAAKLEAAEEDYQRHRGGSARPVVSSDVTITRPGQPQAVVEADALRPAPPEPPWWLTDQHRRAILDPDRSPPRIAFPRARPEEHPEPEPWPPACKGDVVDVTDKVRLVVLGLGVREAEVELHYEILDGRTEHVRVDKAFVPADPMAPKFTVEEHGEREPEPISRAETTELADRVHKAELEKLKRSRGQLGEQLKELASAPREIRWRLKGTIKSLDVRIEEIESQLRRAQHTRGADAARQEHAEREAERASATVGYSAA